MKRAIPKQLDWWRPLWRGLVCDPTGKHRQKMGCAVWLYLYLLLHVDGHTGVLSRDLSRIAKDMAIPERSVRNWLKRLKTYDYISMGENNKRSCLQVVHYRSFRK